MTVKWSIMDTFSILLLHILIFAIITCDISPSQTILFFTKQPSSYGTDTSRAAISCNSYRINYS